MLFSKCEYCGSIGGIGEYRITPATEISSHTTQRGDSTETITTYRLGGAYVGAICDNCVKTEIRKERKFPSYILSICVLIVALMLWFFPTQTNYSFAVGFEHLDWEFFLIAAAVIVGCICLYIIIFTRMEETGDLMLSWKHSDRYSTFDRLFTRKEVRKLDAK